MIDLKIKFVENGMQVVEQYKLISDFTDAYEQGKFKKREENVTQVVIMLFENKFNTKEFKTLRECYNHLVEVMK